jgi:hypothetical protein
MEFAIKAASPQTAAQGVVLVVLDVNKEVSSNALNWALGHVARKGDALRLVGVLTHILNPSKKSPLDQSRLQYACMQKSFRLHAPALLQVSK